MSSDNMGIGGHLRAIGNIIATGAQDAGKKLVDDLKASLPNPDGIKKFMGLDVVKQNHAFKRDVFNKARISEVSNKEVVQQIGKDIATITSSIFKNSWKIIKEEAKSSWKETKTDLKETGKAIKETGKAIKDGAESVIEKGKELVEKKKPGGRISGSFRTHV